MVGRLPEFRDPPLNEVVLGLQTVPIQGLDAAHLGLFWAGIRDAFPRSEEKPALDPVIERFGEKPGAFPAPVFRLLEKPETPRVWFLNPSGDQLVQLQQDRFLYNWRKLEESNPYPRYETLRLAFKGEAERLAKFVARERLGELRPTQCEVTYINHITVCEVWQGHQDLHKVFRTWASPPSGFLPDIEDGQFSMRFVMRDESGAPVARLAVQVVPARLRKDDSPIFRMDLTCRGRPEGDSLEGVIQFLDRGHDWIVRAFADLTTPAMHRIWGRLDG